MSEDTSTAPNPTSRARWWVIGGVAIVAVVAGVMIGLAARSDASTADPAAVRALLEPHAVTPLVAAPEADPALIEWVRRCSSIRS